MIPEQTDATEHQLAAKMVDGWDLSDLQQYVYEDLRENYEHCPDAFEEDWATYMEEVTP